MLRLKKALVIIVVMALFSTIFQVGTFAAGTADPNGFALKNLNGAAGTYEYKDGKYVISATGADIWGDAEALCFVGKQITAGADDNVTATMTLDSLKYPDANTVNSGGAGIIIMNGSEVAGELRFNLVRGQYDTNLRYAFKNSASIKNPQWESKVNIMEDWNSKAGLPLELKLEKKGKMAYAYFKLASGKWQIIKDSRTGDGALCEVGANPYIGIAVAGAAGEDKTARTITATVSKFEYAVEKPNSEPNELTFTNVAGAKGTYKYENGKYIISNSGSDVFAERTDFTFVGKQLELKATDNVVATMKVDSQTFEKIEHAGASAALTLWNGDSTPEKMIIYNVGNSNNGIRFGYRNSYSRANPQWDSKTNIMETWDDKSGYPVELKLEKIDDNVKAYYKKDGKGDWKLLSDGRVGKFVKYEAGDNPYIGIKVTGGTKGEDGTPNMTAVISDFRYAVAPAGTIPQIILPATPTPAPTPTPEPTPGIEPNGMKAADIGTSAIGSIIYRDGKYTVAAYNGDMWENNQNAVYMAKDTKATARDRIEMSATIESISGTNENGKIGLLLHDSDFSESSKNTSFYGTALSAPLDDDAAKNGGTYRGIRTIFKNNYSKLPDVSKKTYWGSSTGMIMDFGALPKAPVDIKIVLDGGKITSWYKKTTDKDWKQIKDDLLSKTNACDIKGNIYAGIFAFGSKAPYDKEGGMVEGVVTNFKLVVKKNTAPVKVYAGNTLVKSTGSDENSALVEYRQYAKAIGATATFAKNKITFKKTAGKTKTTVVLTLNSKVASVNGKNTALTLAPVKSGSACYVPAKALAKLLNVDSVTFK